jgi:DMSO/TMAO reductase YedYZ molybdopterin-dependent catalytic subunit
MLSLRDRLTIADPVAALAAIGSLAGSFAAVGFTPVFLASPLEAWLAKTMPGIVIALAIQELGSLGQQLNLLTAIALTLIAVAAILRGTIALGTRLNNRMVPVVVGGATVWGLTALISGSFASAAGAGLGGAAVLLAASIATLQLPGRSESSERVPDQAKRRLIGAVATTVGVGVVAQTQTGNGTSEPVEPATAPANASSAVRTNLDSAAAKSLGVGGLEPLVSTKFYQVDINSADPAIEPADWSLSVTGAVESPTTYTLEELTDLESQEEFHTIRCVGDSLNGKKMDNALWTGIPAKTIFEEVQPTSDCNCVRLHADDGYFQVFPLEALEAGMFAYEMNGKELPRGHGYPLRALVPGHWGEVQVKWLTEIELLNEDMEGYWEKRGWHGTGPAGTVAKLHAVNDLDDGRKQVAGHAYAGTRGISDVEVSIDGGETWDSAQLSERLAAVDPDADSAPPTAGTNVWRQWAFEYEPPEMGHEVVVRAIEADGTVQPTAQSKAFPDGATGWV